MTEIFHCSGMLYPKIHILKYTLLQETVLSPVKNVHSSVRTIVDGKTFSYWKKKRIKEIFHVLSHKNTECKVSCLCIVWWANKGIKCKHIYTHTYMYTQMHIEPTVTTTVLTFKISIHLSTIYKQTRKTDTFSLGNSTCQLNITFAPIMSLVHSIQNKKYSEVWGNNNN